MRSLLGRNHARTRSASVGLLAAVSLATFVALGWTMSTGFDADKGALLVALIALAMSLAAWLWPARPQVPVKALADDLAGTVQDQWWEEALARKLRDPGVLPLAWVGTERAGSDDQAGSVQLGSEVRLRKLHLQGRLDRSLDEVTKQLALAFRQLDTGRLVILGEPGAGKSVVAILLLIGLLRQRAEGAITPVLLTASSWDPVIESLDDWTVRILAALYYNGEQERPRRLLSSGMLLPILDGLDEIPESARRSAVHKINVAVGAGRPVVVTCRSAEYADIIKGGAPTLHEAPVVEIQPLAGEDVAAHLGSLSWPAGTDWTPVLRALHHPSRSAALAEALSTPLMVSVARLSYESGGDPGELLDSQRFRSRHSIEDYLIDRLIDAAYEPQEPGRARWQPEQAQRWLRFLALHLHGHRDRDLAWWRMSDRILSPWVAPGVGIATGAIFICGMTIANGAAGVPVGGTDPLISGAPFSPVTVVGGLTAVLAMTIWLAASPRSPGRLSVALRGSANRLRRGFRAGAAFAAIPGGLALAWYAVAGIAGDGLSLGLMYGLGEMLGRVAVLTLVSGFALALHHWLNAPPERSARAGPLLLLRQDRRSALAGAAVAGAYFGLLAHQLLMPGATVGLMLGQVVSGSPTVALGWRRLSEMVDQSAGYLWSSESAGDLSALITVVVVPGIAFAVLVLLTRAWPRFVVTRSYLAMQGKMPWRTLRFLSDARDRGLLRQSGGVYQFRHIRFQERLATRPVLASRTTNRTLLQVFRKAPRRWALGLAAALVAIIAVAAPEDPMLPISPQPEEIFDLVALNRNGTLVAATTANGRLLVWRADNGRVLGTREMGGRVGALAMSADGQTVAASVEAVTHVLRTTDLGGPEKAFSSGPESTVKALASTSDGRHWAAVTTEEAIALWADGKVSTLQKSPSEGSGSVVALSLDSDGREAEVITSDEIRGLRHWHVDRLGRPVPGRLELPWVTASAAVAASGAGDAFVVAVRAEGQIFISRTAGNGGSDVIDVGHGADAFSSLTFSADGGVLAGVLGGKVCQWKVSPPVI